jgi:hypothetical protein
MEARRIDRNTYDIFYGKGWDNHVRIRQGRESTYRIGGGRITHPELKELNEVLAPNMPITYGQTMQQMLHNVDAIVNTRN